MTCHQMARSLMSPSASTWLWLGSGTKTFAVGGFAFWAPTFLHLAHGMSLESADHFFGLSLVATGLVATFIGGWTATVWNRRSPSGYAWVLALSAAAAAPAALATFLVSDPLLAKAALVATMFFIFLPTGPTNTLILETVPIAMRASAMAASIFAIHLFGSSLVDDLYDFVVALGDRAVRLLLFRHPDGHVFAL